MSISDRIAVMNHGRVEQFGTPEEIYARPATRYVATFIGSPRMELLPAVVEAGPALRLGTTTLPIAASAQLPVGRAVEIGVRPEHVRLGETGLPATVRMVQPVGPSTHVALDWEGGTITASVPGFLRLHPGTTVRAGFDPDHLVIFDQENGQRLAAPIR